MENQKQMDNQKNAKLKKAIYLIMGIILGAGLWIAAGFICGLTVSIFYPFKYAGIIYGALLLYILPVAFLLWLMRREPKRKFIIFGELLFFAAALLIPNPCSIYTFLGALGTQ